VGFGAKLRGNHKEIVTFAEALVMPRVVQCQVYLGVARALPSVAPGALGSGKKLGDITNEVAPIPELLKAPPAQPEHSRAVWERSWGDSETNRTVPNYAGARWACEAEPGRCLFLAHLCPAVRAA
jgi:hypothetical protein